MKEYIMMSCGCSAAIYKDGKPFCIVHQNGKEMEMSEIPERTALCKNGCGHSVPSNLLLEEFEYRGGGSDYAKTCINCGQTKGPHENRREYGLALDQVCDYYTPHGLEVLDTYNCGCLDGDVLNQAS